MSISRHNMWNTAGQVPDDFKHIFDRFFLSEEGDQSNVVTSQWIPRVDIMEEDRRFVILADIPGVDPKDIEVHMEKSILSIKGERTLENREEGDKFTRIERSRGVFYRRFALPDSADPEGIQAKGRHGVLEISIPKKPESTARRIQIQSGE